MTEMLIEKEKEICLKLMVVMVLLENTMIEVKTGIIYILKISKPKYYNNLYYCKYIIKLNCQ